MGLTIAIKHKSFFPWGTLGVTCCHIFRLALCLGEMLAPRCYYWEENYPKCGMPEHISWRPGGKWDHLVHCSLSYPTAEMGPSHFWFWDQESPTWRYPCLLTNRAAGRGSCLDSPCPSFVFLFASSCSKSVPVVGIEAKTGGSSSGFLSTSRLS